MPRLIGVLFIGGPVLLLIFFAVIIGFQRRVLRNARKVPAGWFQTAGQVTGEWTGYAGNAMSTGSTFARRPTVTFKTSDGRQYTFQSPVYATFMPRPGTVVEVVHDPHRPQNARLGPSAIPRRNNVLFGTVAVVMALILVPLCAVLILIGVLVLRAG